MLRAPDTTGQNLVEAGRDAKKRVPNEVGV